MKPPVGYHRAIKALADAVRHLVSLETATLSLEQRASIVQHAGVSSARADAELDNITEYLARHRLVTTPKPKAQKRGRKP